MCGRSRKGDPVKSEIDSFVHGVEFTRDENGRISAKGPKSFDLRSEVLARLEPARAWLDGGKNNVDRRWGECEICKLAMPPHKGGVCNLCSCAIQKIRDERIAKVIAEVVSEAPVPKDEPRVFVFPKAPWEREE